MADIVAPVHVSRGVLYEYFEGVPACLLAAHEMVAECVLDLVAFACEEGETWKGRVRLALEEVLEFLCREPAYAHLLGPESAAALPAIAASRERLIERLSAHGAEQHSIEGALALVSERVAAGETDQLPDLSPQLSELILPRRGH